MRPSAELTADLLWTALSFAMMRLLCIWAAHLQVLKMRG